MPKKRQRQDPLLSAFGPLTAEQQERYAALCREYPLIGENQEDVSYLMDIGCVERAPGDTAFPDDNEGYEEEGVL